MITVESATAAEQAVALLTEMLEIPSVSTQEARLGQWLVRRMRELGFSARRDEVGNVIGYFGSGAREVMLLGHMDTVPGWIPVRMEENRLHGRGSVDAKGPLAAGISAVTRQEASGSCRFTVIAAVEEEGSSRGARHLINRRPPEHLIILEPSGWDAVTLGYKGSLRIRYRLSQPAGHGAGPLSSAGDRAVAFLRRLQDHASASSDGKPALERLDTRVLRFHADHDGMRDVATMTLGLRLPPGFDIDGFKDRLLSWSEDAEVKVESADPAIRAEKNTPLVRRFVQAIRDAGGTPRFKMKTGTSDMNILVPSWGCPSLAYGPGDSRLDHTPFESIDLDDYRRGIDVLTSALSNL
jgi:LysW-gamma-L-lysine carboxypeptidase